MKKIEFYNTNKELLVYGILISFMIRMAILGFLMNSFISTDNYLKREALISTLEFSQWVAGYLFAVFIGSYCKIQQDIDFSMNIYKIVPHIETKEVTSVLERIGFTEEILKLNCLSIGILIMMWLNHLLHYNTYINSSIVLLTVIIQMALYTRLLVWKKRKEILCFPEVRRDHDIKVEKAKKFAESEAHLPWWQRAF
jgi:uncharacterized protein YacL